MLLFFIGVILIFVAAFFLMIQMTHQKRDDKLTNMFFGIGAIGLILVAIYAVTS